MKSRSKVSGQELFSIYSHNLHSLIDAEGEYVIEKIEAIDLLNFNRLDIVAKYVFSLFRFNEIESDFARNMYLEHIKVFNNFVEADSSMKVGANDFVNSFESLCDSLREQGFDSNKPVPISSNGTILDGAHRVGASLALGYSLDVVRLSAEAPCFDYRFFRGRGLSEGCLDYLALEYARLKSATRMVVLWPTAQRHQSEVERILGKYGDISYFKEVYLNEQGAHNFVTVAYKREAWVGTVKDGFSGAENKANCCFEGSGPVRVFLFEPNQCGNLIKMKDEIRGVFRVGKHSIHVNDTHEETVEISQYLLNSNSVTLLNAGVKRELHWFNKLFSHYISWMNSKNLNANDFCVDGSGTLAAYGIRDVRDLDFFYGKKAIPDTGFKEIDCHNDEHDHVGLTPSDIIYNPYNHFYFKGLKFASIDLIRCLKMRRNEPKDQEDVHAITLLLAGQVVEVPIIERIKKNMRPRYLKAKLKLIALKVRYYLVRLKEGIR